MDTEIEHTETPVPSKSLVAKARHAYATESREADEHKWIMEYLPLVRHIVQKVASQVSYASDMEDLISAGTLGLVKAARRFDASKGVEFKTYAYIRIKGAVIDELRGRSAIPAASHSQIRTVREAYRQFIAEQGRPPTDDELAAKANVPLEQMYKTLADARKQNFLSINEMSDEKPSLGMFLRANNTLSPTDEVERKEMLQKLTEAIMSLPKRDRTILLLYYERDLTMKETAEVLGITESRVSQLHASALFKLGMKLGNKP